MTHTLTGNYTLISATPAPAPGGDRGLFGGAISGGDANTIEYITISSTGNATDFGDLTVQRGWVSPTSNGINGRGVFGGGRTSPGDVLRNVIDYVTILSPGDATDFGDLTVKRLQLSSVSNNTNERGVFGGGYTTSTSNVLDYITISSSGDATNFGDLTVQSQGVSATSNGTNDRGVFAVRFSSDVIDYITISSTGNATDFGDTTATDEYLAGACSNLTNERGIFGGRDDGGSFTVAMNVIQYITISSIGNAIDFGDLTAKRVGPSTTSNGTNERGVFAGGFDNPTYVNIIDYITISSTGNATDFGDLIAVIMLSDTGTSNA